MNKPIELVFEEFRKDMANTMNKYINQIPAVFIEQHLMKLANECNNIAQVQLTQATNNFNSEEETSSEVVKNKES